MKTYTKESLRASLIGIRDRGWIPNARPGNQGGVGNTLEDLLGIKENNLPLPNAAEWELKAHAGKAGTYTTLFHMEPSPRGLDLVPQFLLPVYGWPHKKAGTLYPSSERGFRQTISTRARSDRGFCVVVDEQSERVVISFAATAVSSGHVDWLHQVEANAGHLGELDPQPYWAFSDLFPVAAAKLINCFYVLADKHQQQGLVFFHYQTLYMLKGFSVERFHAALTSGEVLLDFDARTGHNHGTKLRARAGFLPSLYESAEEF